MKNIEIFQGFHRKKGHILALFTFLLFLPDTGISAAEPSTSDAMTEAVMVGVSLMIQVLNVLLWLPLLIIARIDEQ